MTGAPDTVTTRVLTRVVYIEDSTLVGVFCVTAATSLVLVMGMKVDEGVLEVVVEDIEVVEGVDGDDVALDGCSDEV